MTANIAKNFINEQYNVFKSLNYSFSSISKGDHFLGYEAAHMVWDTLYVLADIKLVMDDEADTMEQMMHLLEDLHDEYKSGAIPSGCRVEKNAVDAITRIINAVNDMHCEE